MCMCVCMCIAGAHLLLVGSRSLESFMILESMSKYVSHVSVVSLCYVSKIVESLTSKSKSCFCYASLI